MSEAKEWRECSIDDMTPRQQLALAVRQACVRTHSEPARLAYAGALQAGTGEIDAGDARQLVAKLKELARAGKMPQAEFELVQNMAKEVQKGELAEKLAADYEARALLQAGGALSIRSGTTPRFLAAADGSGYLGDPDTLAWDDSGVTSFDASHLVNPWETPDLLSALYMPNKYGGGERMWAWEGMGYRLNTGYGTEPFLITGEGQLTSEQFKCTEWGGPYVDFNGSTHALTIFDDDPEDSWQEPTTHTFLLWAWVNADALGALSRSIISKWEVSGKLAYNLYWDTTTGNFTFAVSSNGTTPVGVVSSLTESTGVWYFVAGFFQPSTLLRIFVGAADSDIVIDSNTTSIPASIRSSDSKFHFGVDGFGAWWDGGIGISAACRGLPAATVNDYVRALHKRTKQFYGG